MTRTSMGMLYRWAAFESFFTITKPDKNIGNLIHFGQHEKLDAICEIQNEKVLIPLVNFSEKEIDVRTGTIVARAAVVTPKND